MQNNSYIPIRVGETFGEYCQRMDALGVPRKPGGMPASCSPEDMRAVMTANHLRLVAAIQE